MAQLMAPGDRRVHAAERAAALREHIFSAPKEQFHGKPWALIEAIEEFANTEGLPLIFRQNKLKIAVDVLTKLDPKPKVVVEFGTFVGTSALAWGATVRDLHGSDAADLRVYAFELDPKHAQIARDFVTLASLDDVVTVLDGPGDESLKKLYAEGKVVAGKVDVVFLDHWKDAYLPDLKLLEELKLFHPGSVVIADNTDIPGAPDYVEYVKKGGSGESGAVRYETESLEAESLRGPKIVEVTTVLASS